MNDETAQESAITAEFSASDDAGAEAQSAQNAEGSSTPQRTEAPSPQDAPRAEDQTTETAGSITEAVKKAQELKSKSAEGVRSLEDCIQENGYERSAFLTFVEGEDSTFRANLDTQVALFRQMRDLKKVIELLPKDDPNVTLVAQMMERNFSVWEARAQVIEKARKDPTAEQKKQLEQASIFKTEDELIVALGLLEQNRELAGAALGYALTNNGERVAEFRLEREQVEVIIEEAEKRFGAEVAKKISKIIKKPEALGFGTGVVSSVAVEGFAYLMELFNSPDSLYPSTPAHIAALALPVAGMGIGHLVRKLSAVPTRAGGVKFEFKFEPTNSKLISEFAKKSGIVGLSGAETQRYFQRMETVRHKIYAEAGLDLSKTEQLGYLDTGTIGREEPIFGKARLVNAYSAAFEKLLEGREFTDLGADEKLRIKLEATNAAIAELCRLEAAGVVDTELKGGEKERTKDVDAIEKRAQEILAGERAKREISQEQIDEKQKDLEEVSAQIEQLGQIESSLNELFEQLEPLESQRSAAEANKEVIDDLYKDRSERAQRRIEELERKIDSIHEGQRDVQEQSFSLGNQIASIDRQIKTLREEINSITVAAENPVTGNTYTQEEVRSARSAKNGEIEDLENRKTLLQEEKDKVDGELKSWENSDAQIADIKESIARYRVDLEKADSEMLGPRKELIAAQKQIAPLETRRDRLLQQAGRLLQVDGLDYDTFKQKLTELRRKQTTLSADIEKLEGDLQTQKDRPEELVSADDKREAYAMLRTAQLGSIEKGKEIIVKEDGQEKTVTQNGKLLEVTTKVATGDIPKTYEGWLRLLFGPKALSDEYEIENRQICSKADMVIAAMETWGLSDEFFGDKASVIQEVRNRLLEIDKLKGRLTEYERTGRETQLADQIESLNRQNTAALESLYNSVDHLFTINEVRTTQFAVNLIDRLLEKCKTNPFGPSTYEFISISRGIVE